MVQPVPKGKGTSVVVWGAFYAGERSNLVCMARDEEANKGGYSATSYIQVLDEYLPTIWEPGLLFMQDNAPIHTAKKVAKWFEDNGIDILKWLPYSPDLKPIEHLWRKLKELVCQVNPHIEQVADGDGKVWEALSEALARAWELTDEELFITLAKSIENQVQAVILAEK